MNPVLGPVEARLVLGLAGLPGLRIERTLTRRVLAAIPAVHEHYRPQGRATCSRAALVRPPAAPPDTPG